MAPGGRRLTVTADAVDAARRSWPARLQPSRSLGPLAGRTVQRQIEITTHTRPDDDGFDVLAVGHDITAPADENAAPRTAERLELRMRVALPDHHDPVARRAAPRHWPPPGHSRPARRIDGPDGGGDARNGN